jgi:DUF1680 family protein
MNASRLVASVGGYFLSTSDDVVAFHLYGGISTTASLAGGKVFLRETSNYPWSGAIGIEVGPETPLEFTLKLRIPGWARNATAAVNGEPVDVKSGMETGYLSIRRIWRAGDRVALDLPMPPERIYAHPSVKEDIGRVALKRGPLVYCVEEVDNPGGRVQQIELPRASAIEARARSDLFDGIVTLSADARRAERSGWGDSLYRNSPPATSECRLTALPYYLWNNRAKGSMQVWVAEG